MRAFGIAALVVVACTGPTPATPTPAPDPSAPHSAASTRTPIATGGTPSPIASAFASPRPFATIASPTPFATTGIIEPPHGDPELEAQLPAVVDEVEMISFSGRGIEGDRSGRVELQLLDLVGASDDDWSWAMASPTAHLDLIVQAFRVRGSAPNAFLAAFLDTFPNSTGPLQLGAPYMDEETVVSGKSIVILRGTDTAVYLFVRGDTIFAVWTGDDELAERVITVLPDN